MIEYNLLSVNFQFNREATEIYFAPVGQLIFISIAALLKNLAIFKNESE